LKLKVFTFRFSESAEGFNDEPLQEFIADKEVIEFSEHFFVHEKTPYLTLLLSYRLLNHDQRGKIKRPLFTYPSFTLSTKLKPPGVRTSTPSTTDRIFTCNTANRSSLS